MNTPDPYQEMRRRSRDAFALMSELFDAIVDELEQERLLCDRFAELVWQLPDSQARSEALTTWRQVRDA